MSQTIPFFDLKRQWKKLKPTTMPRVEAVLDSQYCIGGPEVVGFEERFAAYVGAQHGISCASGTSALWLALNALGLKKDEIVLTTPFSFVASSSEIYAHGAHPVYIDIEETTFNMSPELLEEWLGLNVEMIDGVAYEKQTHYKVAGMVVVNIFGQCADYARIRSLADTYGLWIVEDAAQSVDARVGTQHAGTFGDIATFSLYPTKNLSGAGDGGIITTNNADLAAKMRSLRSYNSKPDNRYDYQGYGTNSRFDTIQAVIVDEKLKHLPSYTARRRMIAQSYRAAFADTPHLTMPTEQFFHTYHQFALRVNTNHLDRDQVMKNLQERGVGTRVFYPVPLNTIPYLQTDRRLYTQCPLADQMRNEIICLPVWPELTSKEVEYIITTVIDVTTKQPCTPQTQSSARNV